MSLNTFSFFPGLSCVKNGFPPMKMAPKIIKIKYSGDNTIIAVRLNAKSINRLKKFLYMQRSSFIKNAFAFKNNRFYIYIS